MSFIEHLEELRKRLIICVLSVFVGMVVCWFFREQILAFLLDPLYSAWRQVDGLDEPRPLNFSSMLEPFIAYLKLSAIGGLFLAAPVILYQLWRFVSPGLYPKERRFAAPFVLVSSVLFVGGSIMAYSMVFPIGFKFFLEFAAGQEMMTLEAEVSVGDPPDPREEMPQAPQAPKTLPAEPAEGPRDTEALPTAPPAEIIADAGVDASVPEEIVAPTQPSRAVSPAASEPPSPEAAPPPEPVAAPGNPTPSEKAADENPSWYKVFFSFLAKTDCATFTAAPGDAGTRLTVEWQELRCGKLKPEQLVVRREGEKVASVWRAVPAGAPGVQKLVADDPAPSGPHRYTLRHPTNPNAHRLAPVLMVKDYLSFAIRLLLAFGIIFELPIFISFLAVAGIVNYKQLIRFFRYFFVISVVIGAMLTPPDVVTQLLLAMPLMVLYGLSIGVAYLFGERPTE